MRAPSIAGRSLLQIGRCLLEALLREIPKEPPLGLVAMENEDSGLPFPLSEGELRSGGSNEDAWVIATAISLNWLAGFGSFREMMGAQSRNCLTQETLRQELRSMFARDEVFPMFKWSEFFKAKSINYWGGNQGFTLVSVGEHSACLAR